MYVDLDKHVRDLESKRPGSAEAINIRIAQHTYPDLRGYRDHMGVVRLCSSSVNGLCDTMHLVHRTDMDGGSLEVLPFITDKQIQIFADPPIYVIGQRNPFGFGESPLPDWEDLLADSEISKTIINKVRWYFRNHPPINYRDVPD